MHNWAKRYKRKLIQLYAALLYNAHLKGFATGRIFTGTGKVLCAPGLNCYSCPGATAACPLGALQNALAASSVRLPAYVLGILMLYGLMLGRTVCGWLCPFGLIQELLHRIPGRKIEKNRATRALSNLKYVLLLIFAVAIPLAVAAPGFCKYLCPAGTLEGALALLAHPKNQGLFAMLGSLFHLKLAVLVLIVAACVPIYRAFCRFFCPLGAIYGLFSKVAFIGVQVDAPKCVGCDRCVRECPMDIRRVGDRECIHCGKCAACCPTDAIGWKGPKLGGRRARGVRIAMIAVLAVALIAANLPSETAVGAEVGMRCPEFSVPTYDGGAFSISQGRATVINFWATWCAPCVEELPNFARLAENHPEIDVVAIHSELTTEDVSAWIQSRDLNLTFALDEDGSVLESLNGADMLPQTVIVNASGEIVYNAVGSLTYEELEALLETL